MPPGSATPSSLVTELNNDWRVVVCREGVQWVLQHRWADRRSGVDLWNGRSFCHTKDALRRCVREFAGTIDPTAATILATLPADISEFIPAVEDGTTLETDHV